MVRREGSASLGIVDLPTGTRRLDRLSGAVTDVDVTADGTQRRRRRARHRRGGGHPAGGRHPRRRRPSSTYTITGETIGSASIAADGKTVLLYTNAVAADRLTVLTLGAAPTYRVVKLHAPVLAVFASADASNAVVLHSESAPATSGGTSRAAADGGTAPRPTQASPRRPPPTRSAWCRSPPTCRRGSRRPTSPAGGGITAAGDRVLVTERDDAKQIYGVYIGQFPTLEIQKSGSPARRSPSASWPSANEGYVAQKNAEGRITFVALDSGQARTLTGFEIGAGVVDWAQGDAATPPTEE